MSGGQDIHPLFFPPSIIAVTPNAGSSSGGTPVLITGLNFRPGAVVRFGSKVPLPGAVVNGPTSISVTTVAHAPGTVPVVVTNPDGQSASLLNAYTFQAPIVAVGNNVAASSADNGLTWTSQTIPAGNWKAVAWAGPFGYVAIGDANVSAFSRNGLTWTLGGALPNNSSWLGIAANNSVVVASGNDTAAEFVRSLDGGVTWQDTHAGTKTNVAVGGIFGAGAGLFSFIAQSGNADSPDGATWTERNSGANNSNAPGINTMTYNGSVFTALSLQRIWTSPDAVVWTNQGNVLPLSGNNPVMAWSGNVYAALSNRDAAYSSDAVAWTSTPFNVGVASSITWTGSVFVVIFGGSSSVGTSPDGITWTNHPLALPAGTWNAVASPRFP